MFLKIEKNKIITYSIYYLIVLIALLRNIAFENFSFNLSEILIIFIVILAMISTLNISSKIKSLIYENKLIFLILLFVLIHLLLNSFLIFSFNTNIFSEENRIILSNFLTIFLSFYLFILFKDTRFQVYSDNKSMNVLILLATIMSIIIANDTLIIKAVNFNSKFVIISLINFSLVYFFLIEKRKYYLIYSIILSIFIIIYANFYIKLITISFFILIFFEKFFTNYLFRAFIIVLIFSSGFILYQKKTSEILNFKLSKFQDFYHFNIKNDTKTECIVKVEYYKQSKHYNYWQKYEPKYCIGKTKNLIFTYDLVSFNARVDQLINYYENIELKNIESYFFGLTNEEYKRLISQNNFTHNSYLNIFFKYGLLFYILILLFFLSIIRKQNNLQFLVLAMFLSSQIFDDYLFANRFEVSMIFWSMLGGFLINKKSVPSIKKA